MNTRTPKSHLPRAAVAAIVTFAFFALQAGAARADGLAASRVVQYGDLNLTTPAGQRVLRQRIHGAARQVCAPLAGQSLHEQRDWRRCLAHAIGGAQRSLPDFATVVRARSPREAAVDARR